MRKRETHPAEERTDDEDEGEDDDGSWLDRYPSKTVEAVPPNEATAGLNVTFYELYDDDSPPIIEFHQYYPPEDDVEGDSVYVHGEHAALQVGRALSELVSDRFEEVPWDDVE